MATLSDAVEDILDAIVAAITAASNETGGGLDEVVTVVRGDRARPMPALPAVWVLPQPAQADQAEYGDEESWVMRVSIAALVKATDPAEGGKAAQRVASRAAVVAKSIRSTVACVIDTRMDSFDPTARSSERNRNLFWTDATVRVTFTATD